MSRHRAFGSELFPWLVMLAAIIGVGITVALLATAPAAAQNATNVSDVAPYYANQSDAVPNGSYYNGTENATLDSIGDMATRLGPVFIGTGDMDPSGTGFQGALITGFVMILMFVGAWAMLPLGSVGGGVLAVVVGYGLTDLGLAPGWFRVILVFVVGVLAFVAFLQAQQGR